MVEVVAAQLPTPSGAVNDFAGVLTPDEERVLTDLVQGVEDATTAEIAAATVTSLGGMAVEAVLPDGLAGQIIRESFMPRFRDNQYGAGIVEGTTRVAAIVRRNEPLTADELAALDQSSGATASRSNG
jgi:uncharacterized membrane protein YgcG